MQFLVNYARLDFANIKREIEKLVLYCQGKKCNRKKWYRLLAEYDSHNNELFSRNYQVKKIKLVQKEEANFSFIL